MDKKNVTAAKPGIAGAIFTAVAGTQLPTDTAAKLDEAFKNLGYVSEDGLKNAKKSEGEETKAWGGEVVLDNKEKSEDVFEFTLLETTNEDVLKTVHGAANVSGTLSAGITVKVNDDVLLLISYSPIWVMISLGSRPARSALAPSTTSTT